MDLVTYILRKFHLVKSLERSVRNLEQSVLQLQRDRGLLESENQKTRAEMAEWTRFCPHGHFYSPLPSGRASAPTAISTRRCRRGTRWRPHFPEAVTGLRFRPSTSTPMGSSRF